MTETITPGTVIGDGERVAMVRNTIIKLLAYCRENGWAGYDPYDALNSRLFKRLPFLNCKFTRLAFTQTMKRSPLNLRPLLMVPQSRNPKGLALFLAALTKLSKLGLVDDPKLTSELAGELLALRSQADGRWCWGYNFDWQNRTTLVPRGTPNIICTTFAANALLDLYESCHDSYYLDGAVSAADFIRDVLYYEEGCGACFNYTPLSRSAVHNANLLGAAFLCRVGRESGEKRFLEPAMKAARYSAAKQHEDGSWDYGESDRPSQRWTDNFHTGYNLCALQNISRYAQTSEFDSQIRRGFDFYRSHFFRRDGAPKYFNNRVYPIDVHSAAQSIITLLAFQHLGGDSTNLARAVLQWTLANLWDKRGYFYYQKLRCYTNRIPYMRWSEAWMLLALATMLEDQPVSGGEEALTPG